jgi:hypothetical protein
MTDEMARPQSEGDPLRRARQGEEGSRLVHGVAKAVQIAVAGDEVEEIAVLAGGGVGPFAGGAGTIIGTLQPHIEAAEWPDGTRVMVRNTPKSWSEATIYARLDAEYWRVQYPSGGTGMFKEGDLRAYDAERDAKRARLPRQRLTYRRTRNQAKEAGAA